MEIKGYPNYLIFRNGAVLSKGFDKCHKPKFLKLRIDSRGYKYVNLYFNKTRKHHRIHRLLMLHFVPNPNNYEIVDHIDRNRTNNKLSNLRWCNLSTNVSNGSLRSDNTSGIKNIRWDETRNKYTVQIRIQGIRYTKRFDTLDEAKEYLQSLITK